MQPTTSTPTRPPTLAAKVAGRILAVLIGGAVAVGLIPIFDSLSYSVLLLSYILIMLAPLLVFLGWRLVGLWRLGLQRLPSRPGRRAYLWTVVAFVSLTVLVYSLESWRGRRAYTALKREVETKGTSLDLAAVIPPPCRMRTTSAPPLFCGRWSTTTMRFPRLRFCENICAGGTLRLFGACAKSRSRPGRRRRLDRGGGASSSI